MYKKHKWLSGLRNFGAFNQLRQICDLTVCFKTLNLCLIANLAQCNLTGKSFEITYVSYTERYRQAKIIYKQISTDNFMFLRLLFIFSSLLFGLDFYGQKPDNCGIDNSPLINSYETKFLNHFFKDKRTDFDFKNKKVGFFFGPNGQHLGCKKKYFEEVKDHGNPSCYLIKLSKNEKTESGGYDILVVSWSKIFRTKPTRKMIKSLKKNKFEYQDCMN